MLSTLRKKEKRYEQSTLEVAVRMIQAQQISLSKASIQFNIPKGTLHNKIHGKTALQCKKGPGKLLTDVEENKIATWILNMAKIGYPVNTNDVRETVAQIFEIKGSNLKPGKKWMKLFLQRHPNITQRHAEIISKARALVTEPMIRKWFEGLRQHLQEVCADDILVNPERIFNLDETGVQLCPKTGVILAPKNYRAMYDVASGQEKTSITVLCNFSASGGIVTPFIVYPLQRISKEVAQSVPDDWGIGRSDSGWMTGQTFLHYIKEIYLPWLQKNNVTLPALLLVDGHKSHINLELHEFCIQNQIILYCLHPNSTHILQPCDVGIFGPLKAAWKQAARKHKNKDNVQITRTNFARIFAQSFEISMKKNVIVNAFKACGIFPFNPNAVDYSKCMSNRQEEIEHDIPLNDYKTTVDVIEKILRKNTLDKYNEYRRRNKTCKSSLFKLWNKCKNKMDNILLSQSSNIDDSVINSLTIDTSNVDMHVSNIEGILMPQEQHQEGELSVTQLGEDLTLGTNTFIDGIIDIENIPIEIEGVTFLMDHVLKDTNENRMTSIIGNQQEVIELLEPHSTHVLDLTNTATSAHWAAPQTTSTPVSSKPAIPLPWYTEGDDTIVTVSQLVDMPNNQGACQNHEFTPTSQDLSCQVHEPNSQVSSQIPDVPNISQHARDVSLVNNEPSCSNVLNGKIDELLRLPERKKGTKRKQSKSPIPLAITSKKFKEYLELKENEKKKKAEHIINRKMQRAQKKVEKEKAIKDKKLKRMKTSITISKDKDIASSTGPAQDDPVDEGITSNKSVMIPALKTTMTNNLYVFNECIPETEMTNKKNESLSKDKENINFGDYVVVEFQTNKRNRYYVGQVLMCDYENNFIKVRCLRKKASKFDTLIYFVEPSTADLTEVATSAVKNILPCPRIGRRGMISFENAQYDLNVCE